MRATCTECSNGWELRKPADEYSHGPRCSACGSYEITIDTESAEIEDEPQSVAATAFRRFRNGETPAELVEAGLCGPDKARELREQFNELTQAEVQLLTADERAELRSEAFDRGYDTGRADAETEYEELVDQAREEGRQEGYEEAEARFNLELEEAKQAAFEEGKTAGIEEGKELGREMAISEIREELSEEFADVQAELKDAREKARRAGFIEGRELGRKSIDESTEKKSSEIRDLDSLEEEYAAIYLEGLDHGIIIGVGKGMDIGRREFVQDFISTLDSHSGV